MVSKKKKLRRFSDENKRNIRRQLPCPHPRKSNGVPLKFQVFSLVSFKSLTYPSENSVFPEFNSRRCVIPSFIHRNLQARFHSIAAELHVQGGFQSKLN